MTNLALECHHLSKSYDAHCVLADLSLRVAAGQFVTLLGPSGCGKTTTLRLIAGFDSPDSGSITIQGRRVADASKSLPPEQRSIGMVFQEYALFPHLSVADNIGFGLKGGRSGRKEKAARVDDLLALVGLAGLGGRMPHALSGGQQQRVALARALAPSPAIMLLDEPFSNLDAALRAQVRAEVRDILKQAGITSLFVTHDQEEALSLADEVAVMFEGRIAQIDSPQNIYNAPATRDVAAFIGEANFLPGQAEGDTVLCPLGRLPLRHAMQGPVEVLIRPEALRLAAAPATDDIAQARIERLEFYGHDQRLYLRLLPAHIPLIARLESDTFYEAGQAVSVGVKRPVLAFPS